MMYRPLWEKQGSTMHHHGNGANCDSDEVTKHDKMGQRSQEWIEGGILAIGGLVEKNKQQQRRVCSKVLVFKKIRYGGGVLTKDLAVCTFPVKIMHMFSSLTKLPKLSAVFSKSKHLLSFQRHT